MNKTIAMTLSEIAIEEQKEMLSQFGMEYYGWSMGDDPSDDESEPADLRR